MMWLDLDKILVKTGCPQLLLNDLLCKDVKVTVQFDEIIYDTKEKRKSWTRSCTCLYSQILPNIVASFLNEWSAICIKTKAQRYHQYIHKRFFSISNDKKKQQKDIDMWTATPWWGNTSTKEDMRLN